MPAESAGPANPRRRAVLHLAGLGAAAGAAGLLGRTLSASAGPVLPAGLADLPLCHSAALTDAADTVLDSGPGDGANLKPLTLSWNAGALCTSPVPVALEHGIFARHGLRVQVVNFAGSTDQLLEAIATGKADAGVGMALRWLKPMEQGFDVRIAAGIHGGCMYLVGSVPAGVADLQSLRGKTIGIADLADPSKNFFSIVLQKHGIDPNTDVTWRQYPADLLGLAAERGEVQAFVAGDPMVYLLVKRADGKLARVASNVTGDYAHRTCCILGVRGSLLRSDKAAAAALTASLIEAAEWTRANPEGAAQVFARYAPPHTDPAAMTEMLRSYTYDQHPVGEDLRAQIAMYADELKLAGIMKPGTDPAAFARHVTVDLTA